MPIGTGRREERDSVEYGVLDGGGGTKSAKPCPTSYDGDRVAGEGSGEDSREEKESSEDTVKRRLRGVIVSAANWDNGERG